MAEKEKLAWDYDVFGHDGGYAVELSKTDPNHRNSIVYLNNIKWFATKEEALEYAHFLNVTGYNNGRTEMDLTMEMLVENGIKCVHISEIFGKTLDRLRGTDEYKDDVERAYYELDGQNFEDTKLFVVLPLCKMAFSVNTYTKEISKKEEFEYFRHEEETFQNDGYATSQDYWNSRTRLDYDDEYNLLYYMLEDIEEDFK